MRKTLSMVLGAVAVAALGLPGDVQAQSGRDTPPGRATPRQGLPAIGGTINALDCRPPMPIIGLKKTSCPRGYVWYAGKHACCKGVVRFPGQ